jgi:hypothetical protein
MNSFANGLDLLQGLMFKHTRVLASGMSDFVSKNNFNQPDFLLDRQSGFGI